MKLRRGDLVREREGRHVGIVESIFNSAIVRVRWIDNGWCSDLPLGDVRVEP